MHPWKTVSEITGLSRATLYKWQKRGWTAARTTRPFRPVPSDFAIQVNHMDYSELTVHYRTGVGQIANWKRALGLPMRERACASPPHVVKDVGGDEREPIARRT